MFGRFSSEPLHLSEVLVLEACKISLLTKDDCMPPMSNAFELVSADGNENRSELG